MTPAWRILFSALMLIGILTTDAVAQKELIVVVGAAGEEEFGDQFSQWAKDLTESVDDSIQMTRIGMNVESDSEKTDRDLFQEAIQAVADAEVQNELWIVFIGHGTFDGSVAKFNLTGPDFSSEELKSWLQPINSKTVIVNCASCSSPFINHLSGENRIVLSATRDGNQYNFARFGKFFSAAVADQTIDLDKDGQTSLLEAFIAASNGVKEFYDSDGRLSTEQALLDDNGDAKGTPADWFEGTRAVKKATSGLADGLVANQTFFIQRETGIVLSSAALEKRDSLETDLEKLRELKPSIDEDDYYGRLENIMVQLAELYSNDSANEGDLQK